MWGRVWYELFWKCPGNLKLSANANTNKALNIIRLFRTKEPRIDTKHRETRVC